MRTLRLAAAAAALTCAAIGISAGAANAAAPQDNGQQIAQNVLQSANPQAAYQNLTTAQKTAYGEATRPVSVVTQAGPAQPISAQQAETQQKSAITSFVAPDAMAASAGCWDAYVHYDWNAAAGNTVYTTWQGLEWCSNGSAVTSYFVYVRGGETSTPGWSYQGNNGQGSWNVGWEVRQYTAEKFTFGIGSYGYSTTPCTQIRGGATGLYSYRSSCDLS